MRSINWPVPAGFFIIILLAALSARAQSAFSDPMPRYERNGDAFGCRLGKEDYEKARVEERDACLWIGPLYMGMLRGEVEKILGDPADVIEAQGDKIYVYALNDGPGENVATYAVLQYRPDGRARVVQVTGAPWPGNWQFAGLGLGVADSAVEARLGKPFENKDSANPGFIVWSYYPWAFSLEFKDGTLYSIRFWEK